MTGAGFTLPSFNADAGDCCQSGGIVPITNVSKGSLLVQSVNCGSLILRGSYISLEELIDLSSLKFFRPFLCKISFWVLLLSPYFELSNMD